MISSSPPSYNPYYVKDYHKLEKCIVCEDEKICRALFCNLPFCEKCEIHTYNGDIDISESLNKGTIIWNNVDLKDERIDKLTTNNNIKKSLVFCKNIIDKALQKLRNENGNDIEDDIREAIRHIEYAFYIASR